MPIQYLNLGGGLGVRYEAAAAACLVIALAFLPAVTVQKAWGLPFYPSFAIPIIMYALLLVSRDVLSKPTDHAESA